MNAHLYLPDPRRRPALEALLAPYGNSLRQHWLGPGDEDEAAALCIAARGESVDGATGYDGYGYRPFPPPGQDRAFIALYDRAVVAEGPAGPLRVGPDGIWVVGFDNLPILRGALHQAWEAALDLVARDAGAILERHPESGLDDMAEWLEVRPEALRRALRRR